MAHEVKLKAPTLTVGKKDVLFAVRIDGHEHGRLKVSHRGCRVDASQQEQKCIPPELDSLAGSFHAIREENRNSRR